MRHKRVLAAAAAALLLLGGAYAARLRHLARQPVSIAPAGTYPVGRAVHELADRSRTDELAPLGGNPRVLSAWLWYPAAAAAGTPSAYAPGAWGGLHEFGWAQTGFDRIRTGTYDEAPPAAGPFPIVVLLPGLGLAAPQYAAVASALAARGYLVAGVTPTYSAGLTVLAGQPVRASAAGGPRLSGPAGERLAVVWAADARFVADRVGALLGPHADTGRIIYLGHGFGGAAALEACRTDDDCAGAADLDGSPVGPVVTAGLRRPLLVLSSGEGGADADPAVRALVAASGPAARQYTIRDARHYDFTDYAAYRLAAPARLLLPLGTAAALPITTAYLGAFLDMAARGTPWRAPGYPQVRPAETRSR